MDAENIESMPTGELLPIARFDDLQSAQEYALVILAMQLDCLITVEPIGYYLHADTNFHPAIQREFESYKEEQITETAPSSIPVFRSGLEIALIWITTLLVCHVSKLEDPGVTEKYLNSSQAVIANHEYFRTFTALFLHADMAHLISNATFGLLFGLFVSTSYGPIRGWALILLSGTLGNLLNVWFRYPTPFLSLGASTAVFGALGLLIGNSLYLAWQASSYRKGLRAFTPLLAGLMIFTFNGIGTPGTDTIAHITGLFAGIAIGLFTTPFISRKTT